MKCDCLKTVLEKVKKDLTPKFDVTDFKVSWKGEVLRFDGGCGVGLYIDSQYRKKKNNGESYKNITKDNHFIAMSFCPFCGSKIEKEQV